MSDNVFLKSLAHKNILPRIILFDCNKPRRFLSFLINSKIGEVLFNMHLALNNRHFLVIVIKIE